MVKMLGNNENSPQKAEAEILVPRAAACLSIRNSSEMCIKDLKDVDIDPEGVFKYILIKVYEPQKEKETAKNIVRGYKRCPYHADIYDEVQDKELNPRRLSSECLGGGRINHDPAEKTIKVYGYSQGFGKADHSVSVALLKNTYPEYIITWSHEGY